MIEIIIGACFFLGGIALRIIFDDINGKK